MAREADGGEHRLHARVGLGATGRAARQAHAHVLLDREPREEREVLEDDGGAGVDADERLAVLLDGPRASAGSGR